MWEREREERGVRGKGGSRGREEGDEKREGRGRERRLIEMIRNILKLISYRIPVTRFESQGTLRGRYLEPIVRDN